MCEQLTAYLVLQSLVQLFFPFVKKSMECWWERIIPRQSITPNRTGSPARSFVQYYANSKKIKKHKQHLSDRNCVVRHRTLIFCLPVDRETWAGCTRQFRRVSVDSLLQVYLNCLPWWWEKTANCSLFNKEVNLKTWKRVFPHNDDDLYKGINSWEGLLWWSRPAKSLSKWERSFTYLLKNPHLLKIVCQGDHIICHEAPFSLSE